MPLRAMVRLLVAGAIVVGLVVVTAISALGPHLRVCVDGVGCRPLTITDAPVLLGLVLALGVISPDVRRLRVGPEGVDLTRDTVDPEDDLPEEQERLEVKAERFETEIERRPPSEGSGP